MKETKVLLPTKENMAYATQQILDGEVVGIPTETVYGLAANAYDEKAIKKIFEAKGRPQDNPLIVHISNMDMLKPIVSEVSETAMKIAKAFWPGALTIIMPKSDKIGTVVTGGLDTVAVRMPSHKVALDFITECGVPLAAPSANVSGKPSPTKAKHVLHDLNGKIECIIDGGECEVGVESTVIAVSDNSAEILRPGEITIDDLLKVVETVKIDDGVFSKLDEDTKVSSPGMKYKHYAPNAKVIMVEGSLSEFCRYVSKKADDKTGVLVFDGEDNMFSIPAFAYGKKESSMEQASKLFDALRQIDNEDITTVFARVPNQDGVGLAVYNRLLRACGFNVVTLKKAKIIGLTGQTGSGKTTVGTALSRKGMGIIDCDQVARDVINNEDVIRKLSNYFGKEILNEDNSINRKALAGKVFTDEDSLQYLNNVMYPRITQDIKGIIEKLTQKGHEIIILDAPTLFESDANLLCDKVVSVISSVDTRKSRIMARDNMTSQEAMNRINSQHDDDFYREKSDYVLENDGEVMLLNEKIEFLIEWLLGC